VKHPITGKIQMRRVPQSQWTIKHFPDLAIVTTEQWDRVRSIVDTRKSLGIARMAGSGKRDKSAPISLFSGLLFCDECGNPFVVSGKVERGARFLKCKTFRYERQKCSCSLGLDDALLETRLVEHLVSRVLAHEPLESAIEHFHEVLNAHILSAEENRRKAEASFGHTASRAERLRKERENIVARAGEPMSIPPTRRAVSQEMKLRIKQDCLSRKHPTANTAK
jgi:Recombinase zinc beta ribbon domain